jgi:hypothetical protein
MKVEEGQRVLRDLGLKFTVADGMKDATEKVVALANPAAGRRLRTSKRRIDESLAKDAQRSS